MFLILRMASNPQLTGERANGRAINALGWITTIAIFAATAGLAVSWFL